MIGWETSDEKDGGFSSVAKALGVEVCLDEIHLGLLKVQNTEYQGSGSSLQPSSLSWRMVVREAELLAATSTLCDALFVRQLLAFITGDEPPQVGPLNGFEILLDTWFLFSSLNIACSCCRS